jgi:hypothetical protein
MTCEGGKYNESRNRTQGHGYSKVPQIWEAAPWHKQGEQEERGTWDWVTVPMLEGVLRDMNNDRNWRVREVVHNPRYRFEARPEDIGT